MNLSMAHCNHAGPDLFLAWAGWACLWAGVMILALTALGACRYIHLFTRFAGELFGALIAVSTCATQFCQTQSNAVFTVSCSSKC